MPHNSILAFDFGTKSIGIAASHAAEDDLTHACTELKAIKAREGIPNWDELGLILKEWQPKTVIVGLPLKMDGSDMEITRRARKFGKRIQGMFGYSIEFVDETLSTKAAKSEAYERGHQGNYSQKPVDSIAARLILETWLAGRKDTPSSLK